MTTAKAILQLHSTVNKSFVGYIRQLLFTPESLTTTKPKPINVTMSLSGTGLLRAPAAERNKEPILEVLKEILPQGKHLEVLEIASGTGQHIAHFAKSLSQIQWQPSEYAENSLKSIEAFIKHYELTNVKKPLLIDVCKPVSEWPSSVSTQASLDGIMCSNMIHISPWQCTQGLFSSAGYLLKPGGLLITYGPYSVNGVLTPESNVNFDRSLRQQDPEWGVRDVQDLIQLGLQNGLTLVKTFEMPANNKILIFQKSDSHY